MTNILVHKGTREIKHQGADYTIDDVRVAVEQNGVLLFYFGDLKSSNAEVAEIDTPITDFVGNKYLFVDDEVVENPDYISPEE
jgi:hypothetical protein